MIGTAIPLCGTNNSASSESEDDELEDLIKSAPPGTLQGLEDEYDDNEEGMAAKDTGTAGLRTKNEVVEELGPVSLSEISITSQTVIEYLGTVEKVMEPVAIVRAHTGGEYRILDQGGVIVTENRKLVGTVSGHLWRLTNAPRYQTPSDLLNNPAISYDLRKL